MHTAINSHEDSLSRGELPSGIDTPQSNLSQELQAMADDSNQKKIESNDSKYRLEVVEGLTPPKSERLAPGEPYRFLVTAALQGSATETGDWLRGDGDGFRATDRPVNASLIDQDHNWTFAGENGFILEPPTDGNDIIAAQAYDIGSSDLEPQAVEPDAAGLLSATDPRGYNQINIAAGNVAGVYIRYGEDGSELGRPGQAAELRAFADEHHLPVVEIPVKPQELRAGEASVQELSAKNGNSLWKVRLPEDGSVHEVDIIQLRDGETALGINPNELGFDMRVLATDPYGQSEWIENKADALASVLPRMEQLLASGATQESTRPAIEFAVHRMKEVTSSTA